MKHKAPIFIIGSLVIVAAIVAYMLFVPAKPHTPVVTKTPAEIAFTNDNYTIKANYISDSADTESEVKNFVQSIIDSAKKNWGPGGEMDPASFKKDFPDEFHPYELVISTKEIDAEKLGLRNYSIESYEFTGGAHGGAAQSTFTFSDTGRVRVSDIVNLEGENAMIITKNVIAPKLSEKLGEYADAEWIQSGLGLVCLDAAKKSLLENEELCKAGYDFKKNFETVVIADDGLHVIFGQYQVGPYVLGNPEIVISWKELEQYIKSDYKQKVLV